MFTRCGQPQLQHALAMTLDGLAGADDVRGADRVPLTLDADLERVESVVVGRADLSLQLSTCRPVDLSTCLDLSTVQLFSSLLLVAKEDDASYLARPRELI